MGSIVSSSLSVSVIIPCYRCAETIERAVDSVLNQTQIPEEIILVDDFSDDGSSTLSCLKNLKQKYQKFNIQILALEKNQGPGSARNEAWKRASQPYIAFLDADDSWHPNKLEIQYSWMNGHPEVLLTAHSSIQLSKVSSQIKFNHSKNFYPLNLIKFLFFNCIPTRSVMLKREINYRFLPGKRYAEDYLLWLSIALDRHPIYFLDLPLSYSYKNEFGDASLTSHLSRAHAGLVDTYQQLLKDRRILWLTCIALITFAYIKYLRRLLMVGYLKFLNATRN
jgi:glycosyltransferase involved in cell wall biosynthesis